MKRTACALLLIALPIAVTFSQEGAKTRSVLMQKKLEHSQQILEGLATEDFALIAKNAKILSTYTQLETWTRSGLPQYETQLKIFRFANDEMIRQAEAKNLDGCSLAYIQLTLGCVNCHKVVRDESR